MYDTVDRLRLRRIDVADRTDDVTTYQKVERDPDGSRRRSRAASRQVSAKMGKRGPMFWRRLPRWFRRTVVIGMFSFFLMMVAGVAVVYAATRVPLPGEVKTDQTTIIYYNDGSNEVARIGTVNRTDVPIGEVSQEAIHAVLAAENKNFYSEPGISPRGIARALWVNVTNGEVSQGGSTITQQYAKNAYLTQERTFSRKLREIVLAVKLDQKYSKDEILEFYLNTIYFGRGSYGIEAAAKTYFNVHASQLTAEQGAVIAGLIRSPHDLDPRVDPTAAQGRWHDVLNTMVAMGWLDSGRIAANPTPPETLARDPSNGQNASAQASYIREQVKRELMAQGFTEDQINLEGLRVYTTLDQGRQMASFQAVSQVLSETYAKVPDLRTGLVALEPGTGRVLAWYGGSLYGADKSTGMEFWTDNVAQAQVPAGSTFKAITLAAALREGESLRSTWPGPEKLELPGGYVVHNDEGHEDFGYPDLTEAMAESINTVYVPLGLKYGLANVEQTARDMGVPESVSLRDADGQLVAGMNLGDNDIPALDMASVYSTLAANGKQANPHIVEKVTDGDGNVVYQANDSSRQGIPSGVAADTTHALQAVIEDGTGKKNAQLAGGRPAAGKTGTTDNFRSAWFCGYTPQIASCVNMFRGDGGTTEATELRSIPGAPDGVYGGTYPAKIWKVFMDAALANEQVVQFPPPVYGGTATDSSPPPTTPPPTEPTLDPSATTTGSPGSGIDVHIDPLFPTASSAPPGQPNQPSQPGQQPSAQQPARPPEQRDGLVNIG